MSDATEMVDAINKYLETGATVDLVELIETTTLEDVLNALRAANNDITFEEMVEELGITGADEAIELEAAYSMVLQLVYRVLDSVDVNGGDRTLADYATGEFATYGTTKENWHRLNIELELILADELALDPPVFVDVTMDSNDDIYAMKAENEYIFIDTIADGIAHDLFEQYVKFNFDNADTIEYVFSDTDNGLVQTGETVTVTATNAAGSVTVTYTVIVLGDVNCDGRVYSNDAAIILQNVVELVTLSEVEMLAAQINTAEGVDSADAAIVHRKVVELSYTTWLDN